MKLIDADALREMKRTTSDGYGGFVEVVEVEDIDAAPAVSCEECANHYSHHDMCRSCFGANMFERRQP